MKNSDNRLNAKDLINVGIYTAIDAVLCCIVAMTGVTHDAELIKSACTGIFRLNALQKANHYNIKRGKHSNVMISRILRCFITNATYFPSKFYRK